MRKPKQTTNAVIYAHPGFDLVCTPGVMFVGIPAESEIEIDKTIVALGGYAVTPNAVWPMKIAKIGNKKPGGQSAGFDHLLMHNGAWLEFAGSVSNELGKLLMFQAFDPDGRKMPIQTEYPGLYVAFYELSNNLARVTTSRSTRVYAKEITLLEP